ncbi:hypothetical protein FCULG_00012830 [Fusarium culmorum]|uniref:Uncharacterized protein n=1 Tax=Fusarium culmorum TaxID=5516 RepID=A0A2T4GIU0_FUSCU|nr:hypothetical protein FCULG_00012830 [Fusarium culmorum]
MLRHDIIITIAVSIAILGIVACIVIWRWCFSCSSRIRIDEEACPSVKLTESGLQFPHTFNKVEIHINPKILDEYFMDESESERIDLTTIICHQEIYDEEQFKKEEIERPIRGSWFQARDIKGEVLKSLPVPVHKVRERDSKKLWEEIKQLVGSIA